MFTANARFIAADAIVFEPGAQIRTNWSGERFRKSERLLRAFKAAVEAGEMTGFKHSGMQAD